MRSRKRILALLAIVFLILAMPAFVGAGAWRRRRQARRRNIREFLGLGPAPDPALAKKGEPLYLENCSGCHGKDGRGAQAPGLTRMPVVLHDEKGEKLAPILKEGRQGMPPFPRLSPEDIYHISQFLKLQIELAANRGTYGESYGNLRNQVTGDAQKGAAFFHGQLHKLPFGDGRSRQDWREVSAIVGPEKSLPLAGDARPGEGESEDAGRQSRRRPRQDQQRFRHLFDRRAGQLPLLAASYGESRNRGQTDRTPRIVAEIQRRRHQQPGCLFDDTQMKTLRLFS